MPTFEFDVTEEAVDYATYKMNQMSGNPGQDSLLESLQIDATAVVSVHIAGRDVDIEPRYDIRFDSSHPGAIEQIINKGEQAFQEYVERAAETLKLVDKAFQLL